MAAFSLRAESACATLDRAFSLPLEREAIEAAVEHLIDLLDQMDGDPDQEPNGDELDGINSEDDWWDHAAWSGEPGCPISDPGEDLGDHERDAAVRAFYGIDQTQLPWRLCHL